MHCAQSITFTCLMIVDAIQHFFFFALVRGILFLKPKWQTFLNATIIYFNINSSSYEGLSGRWKTCSKKKYSVQLLADGKILLNHQEIALDSQGEIPFCSYHRIGRLHCSLFIILLLPLVYSLDPEKSPWRFYNTCFGHLDDGSVFLYGFIFCFSYCQGCLSRACPTYSSR